MPKTLKIWLKIQHVRAYNFAISGNIFTKLYLATWSEAGVIMWVQLLEWVPQQYLGGQKPVQNSTRFLTIVYF